MFKYALFLKYYDETVKNMRSQTLYLIPPFYIKHLHPTYDHFKKNIQMKK